MKIKNDALGLALFLFPLAVAVFMTVEGVLYPMFTGNNLLGIPPTVGALSIVVSCFAIPFAILRSGGDSDADNDR